MIYSFIKFPAKLALFSNKEFQKINLCKEDVSNVPSI